MEFQAVVLAGGSGSRMTDVTSKSPKALLPVANMPMVWYPVNLLQKAGFPEAIVVVKESNKVDIQKALVDKCQVKMKLEFVSIPDNEDWGTADSLRHVAAKLTRDVLLISSDLITDISLHLLADLHRSQDATLTALMAPLPDVSETQVPGGKANRKVEKDFVGLDENGTRLLFLSSEADLEENIVFKKSFLKRHPYIDLRNDLMDAHLYLMKNSVISFLKEEESVSTVKGELLPKLVRRQFSSLSKTASDDVKNVADVSMMPDNDSGTNEEDNFSKYTQEMSSYPQNGKGANIKCFAFVLDGGYCVRANNIAMYCEANKQVPRHLSSISLGGEIPSVHPSVTFSKSTVGADSLVDEGCKIGERVAIKKSIIGRYCTIGDKVKVSNSVVMDHSSIQEGSVITGSIVCSNVEIGEKCELKDTLVAAGQRMNPMGKFTNEAIVEMDRMMEIE